MIISLKPHTYLLILFLSFYANYKTCAHSLLGGDLKNHSQALVSEVSQASFNFSLLEEDEEKLERINPDLLHNILIPGNKQTIHTSETTLQFVYPNSKKEQSFCRLKLFCIFRI